MVPDVMAEILIVGSGPAGTAAALACAQEGVPAVMLDAGIVPPTTPPTIDENFYDYAQRYDVTDLLVGPHYEGLYTLNPQNPHISFLLTMPKYAFVRAHTQRLLPVEQNNISVVQTLARGGLANAWGGAAYRYTEADLHEYPISAAELDPYYDLLTKELGINGQEDDLAPFFGSSEHLLPPVQLGENSAAILRKYRRRRGRINRVGVFVGRMRSAVLTEDRPGRTAYPYRSTDTVAATDAFYSPTYTLDRLVAEGKLHYVPGVLVERFERSGEVLRVLGRNMESNQPVEFLCRRLLLAAGAVGTARIVLRSFADFSTELPLLDNPAAYIPSFLPGRFGKKLDVTGYGFATLAIVYRMPEFSPFLQGLVFETMTVPRAEFVRHMPFAAQMNLRLVKYVLPAMVVVILYFPSSALPPGRLRLRPDGTLVLSGPSSHVPDWVVHRAIRLNRKLGLYTTAGFAEKTIYGGSIHYAGCLPMQHTPSSRYHTDRHGQLADMPGVHVVDGAALPALSAKNHTLTLMANAMRIATWVCRRRSQQISTRGSS